MLRVWHTSDNVSRHCRGLSRQLLTVVVVQPRSFPAWRCLLPLLQLLSLLLLLILRTMLRLTVYSSNLIANFVPRQLQLAPANVLGTNKVLKQQGSKRVGGVAY